MKFQKNIQEQFIKARWYENRDVSSLYENFNIPEILFYPFAYFFPGCYMETCDKNGKVYLLGEEIFLISKDLNQ